jgi:SAM-dependent methyltransferase
MTDGIVLLVHPKIELIVNNVVAMFSIGLNRISIEAAIIKGNSTNINNNVRTIVFGGNFYTDVEISTLNNKLRKNSIIFNIENVSSNFMTDTYLSFLKQFHIWDYSAANAVALSEKVKRRVTHVKLFYCQSLARIPEIPDKDIDVLFYGSFNERRSTILDDLRARGLRVCAVYGVYGEKLDELIARSKVVLNIHFYENGHFQSTRVFDLLANQRAVVCEESPVGDVDPDLAESLILAPYERLADAVEELVRDDARRERVAAAGHDALVRRRPREILMGALAESEGAVLPSAAVVGSGKSYDHTMVNIDFDVRWQPDIVADITDSGLFEREFNSAKYGLVRLVRGWFDTIVVSHVLEHLPDLVGAMTNLLDLLAEGGELRVTVPYDLSYGAWQDPTHAHAFNERSWLYYCEWYWYLGWSESRFDLISQKFVRSPHGNALAEKGVPEEEMLRTPRAIDEMQVVLRKRALSDDERAYGRATCGDMRFANQA